MLPHPKLWGTVGVQVHYVAAKAAPVCKKLSLKT